MKFYYINCSFWSIFVLGNGKDGSLSEKANYKYTQNIGKIQIYDHIKCKHK